MSLFPAPLIVSVPLLAIVKIPAKSPPVHPISPLSSAFVLSPVRVPLSIVNDPFPYTVSRSVEREILACQR